jgi:hypothetical protein
MLRTQAPRAILRSLPGFSKRSPVPRFNTQSHPTLSLASQLCTQSARRPLLGSTVLTKTGSTTYIRHNGKYDKPDIKHEAKVAKEKLEAHPEAVSTTSSMHGLGSNRQPESSVATQEEQLHTHGGIYDDLVRSCITETYGFRKRLTSTSEPSERPLTSQKYLVKHMCSDWLVWFRTLRHRSQRLVWHLRLILRTRPARAT